MTKITSLREVIDKSFDKKDINEIYDLMSENGFSATNLKILYKKEIKKKFKGLFFDKNFWSSKLPLLYLKDILKTDLKNDFLNHYFRQNKFCNHQLNQSLASISLSDFLVFFKMKKAFRHDYFMNSLEKMSRTEPNLKVFYKEVLAIRATSTNLKKKQKEVRNELIKKEIDTIFLGFALWHQNLKVSPSIFNNKSLQTSKETAAAEELNGVLKLYKNKKQKTILFNSNSKLQDLFGTNKSAHPLLDKYENRKSRNEVLQDTSDLIDKAIEISAFNYNVDLYLCGYAAIKLIDSDEIELLTNKHFTTFNFNDIKKGCEEMYFLPDINELLSNPKNIPHNYEINLSIFNFYGFPLFIKELGIDFHKVFKLLDYFSVFKSTVSNNDARIKKKQRTISEFREYFGSSESITLFNYEKLLYGIQEFFKWEKTDVENILNFLTFDLSAKVYPKNWLSTPFLRIENKVIWLGTFLKDRRWENILINRIKQENDFIKIQQDSASNFEIKIQDLFKKSEFTTVQGYEFKNTNGESGDIDLLAFKDNYLFICEAKSSIRSDDFSRSVLTQSITLEGKAAHQLVKCETNIEEDWEKIKAELNLDKELQLEDVKIVPLIVTDHFEGDLSVYLGKYQKVSFLELDVIMSNTKKELLEKYLFHEKLTNTKFRDLNVQEILEKSDLWNGNDELKVEFIEQNIKDNSVWKGLEKLIDTNERELSIPMME